MSFKVGQRVRIVKSTRGLEGRAATIISVAHECRDRKSGENYIGHWIDIDGIGERNLETGRRWSSPPHWLEPLDDDSRGKRHAAPA